jgi:ATP-dependent protease ClpP protease subunit
MIFKKRKSANGSEEIDPIEYEMQMGVNFIGSGIDLEKRVIEIRGEVSEPMSSYVTRALITMSNMNHDPITIYLSSGGGDAYEGFAIYDFIKQCPCQINIIASGKIFSAGFLILLAGNTRIALPHTTFMMHSVISIPEGNHTVKQQEVDLNESKRINNAFLDIAAERTKRNRKWWARTILPQDRYFNVEEGKEIGILTDRPVKKTTPIVKKVTKKTVKKGKK